MSKKGIITIVKEDKIKAVYIHRNAQLEGIGKRIVRLCRENTAEELKELYDRLILVDEDMPMTQEQKEAYKKYMPEQILKIAKGGLEIISQTVDEFFDDADYCEKITPCVLAEFPLDNIPDNWLDICKEKWRSIQIICLPWDEAAIHSNEAESDKELQHSAKAMEFFMGICNNTA